MIRDYLLTFHLFSKIWQALFIRPASHNIQWENNDIIAAQECSNDLVLADQIKILYSNSKKWVLPNQKFTPLKKGFRSALDLVQM